MPDLMANKQYVVDPKRFPSLCSCGKTHPRAETRYYSGWDAYEVLARDCAQAFGAGPLLLLDDENTRVAAGQKISSLLSGQGVEHDHLTLPGGAVASQEYLDEILRRGSACRLTLAVGAGSINDMAKYTSSLLERTYWCLPTAPSMNGFTSSIAAIKQAGIKRTLPAPPPQLIYADPGVIARAPLELIQAGYCDIMAKSVSDIDWQIDSMLYGGSYCTLSTRLVGLTEELYLNKPERLGRGDRDAAMGLFEGLLTSGLAMSLAGSSAPASGGEHLVSHFFDMREPVTGKKPQLHGLQVAMGIILSAACYQRLERLETDALLSDPAPIFQAAARGTGTLWGEAAPGVLERFELKRGQLARLDRLLPARWDEIRALCAQVMDPRYYLDLFRRTGLELSLEAFGISMDEFRRAALYARTIRERITVLDLAAQAGVLQPAAEDAVGLL